MSDHAFITAAPESLFGAIGRHTISWAFVESAIEYMVVASHSWAGGDEIEPEMPWSLDRKLRFLRKSFDRLPKFKPYATDGLPLLDDIKIASDIRHDIIHGVVTNNPDLALEVKMVRILRSKTERTIKEYRFSTIEILEAAVAANELGRRALPLAMRIVGDLSPD
ncbi:MAG: hypothetical protein ACREO5_14385 [Candidatus Binatia bacterium]